ncbi:uncharacterized protein LOC127245065 [Andrographis paniculata]|uniref:uncharacterized protein LOC127245065 n=1 Tax=Andrographis paniculata TaxID=175694 RepID=UPI0021E8E76B|nr:uncharacterized protein LOC127245065 [Andrographis paniculata]
MAASTEEDLKKKSQPQLVKLDRAFKLAEQWVNNMSKSSSHDEKSPSVELEGRPAGLGIGATVPKESKVALTNNPVERKLFSKLQTENRKANKRDENLASNAKVDEDSEEDESESRTRAFSKRRPLSLSSPLNAKRKNRR